MSLFRDEMAAQSGDDPARLVLNGPAVLLMPRAVSTMALVIHAITNSIKYGALSTVGTVCVTAEPASDGLWLQWRERGGPAVQAPERRGFGSVIVERTVIFDLHGKTAGYAGCRRLRGGTSSFRSSTSPRFPSMSLRRNPAKRVRTSPSYLRIGPLKG